MCSFADEYTKILNSIEINDVYTMDEYNEAVKKIDEIEKSIKAEIFKYNEKIELLRDDREKLIITLSHLVEKSSEFEKAEQHKSKKIIDFNNDKVVESNILKTQPDKKKSRSKKVENVNDTVIGEPKIIEEPIKNIIENNDVVNEELIKTESKPIKKTRSKKIEK